MNVSDFTGAEVPAFPIFQWKNVTLAYAWNEDLALKFKSADYPTCIAWYRKHFTFPTDAMGKKVADEIHDKDGFGIVEVSGKNPSIAATFDTPGTLEFMKPEFYEPPSPSEHQ